MLRFRNNQFLELHTLLFRIQTFFKIIPWDLNKQYTIYLHCIFTYLHFENVQYVLVQYTHRVINDRMEKYSSLLSSFQSSIVVQH